MSVGKKESKDWEDSYYSMEEKYLAIQKKLNQKEEELKLIKVKHLRESMTTALKNANARKSKRNDGGSLDVSPRAGLNHSVHDSGDRGSPLDDIIRHSARGGNIPERRPATVARSPIGSKGAKGKQRMGRGRGVLTNSRRINGSVIRGVNNGQTSESQFEHYQGQQGQWEGIETAQINTAGNPNLSDIGTRPTFDSHFIASAPLPHSNVPRNHPFSAVDGADESLNFASYNYPYSTQNTNEAAYGASGLSGSSVDPLMMLWGHCGATEQTNMLMNLNTQLKVTIEDMEESMKTIQHDLANCRATNTALQKRLDENQVEMHQLVRERDLASQKLHNSNHTISQQQQSLQVALDDKENLRYGLESQIRELRSRLVSSTDNSNEMASDVRTLLTDLRESNGRVAALESKVSLLESNNVTQSNTNRTLVVEAESLNQQLANERRKVLGLVRDLHSASTQMGRIQELEGRVSLLHNEKISLEKEHIRLLDDMMKVTQSAATAAREEVQAQLVAVSEAAHHWERVSKLLYKDVADRTTTHIRCREECEEAKRGRDEAEMNLRRVRRDLEMSNAKLSIIWPRHVKDTQHFDTPESIISSFKRIQNARNGSNTYNVSKASQIYSSAYAPGVANSNLSFLADIPLEEQVMELHEANSALVVELEAMKIANELLTEQLNDAQGKNVAIVKKATNERDEASDRERKGHQVVMAQNQRIAFLEEQVNLMRGVKVQQGGPSLSIDTLGSNETIIEVFIGQLILYSNIANSNTNPPHQLMSVEDGIPMLFCTIDFLVHETITSTVVTGFNSFFDLSVGYRIKLDSLFLYYLCTRGLVVQLHRLKDSTSKNYSDDITTNSTLTYETIGEGIVSLLDLVNNETLLLSPRPQLKGHITLHPPSGANQSFISPTASVPALEFSVTFRTPFPATFIEQCRKQICSTSVKQRIQESHKYSLLEHQRQRTGATGGDRHSLELSTMSGDPIEVMYPNINIMNPTTGHLSPKQGETDLQQYTTVGAASLALLLDNVKSVSLRPVSLEIEHHLTNIPMLSLFYLVPSLGLNECHVPFPYSAPRYNIQYEAVQVKARTDHFENIAAQLSNKNEDYKTMNGAFTRTISVPSGHRLAQAIQEPIPVFAFNDSEEVFLEESTAPLNNNNENSAMSSNTSSAKHMKYWGIAVVSWTSVFSVLGHKCGEDKSEHRETILTANMLAADGSKVATLKFGVSFNTKDSHQYISSSLLNTRNEENNIIGSNTQQTGVSSTTPVNNNNYRANINLENNYQQSSELVGITTHNLVDTNLPPPQSNHGITATYQPNQQHTGRYEGANNEMTSTTATTISSTSSNTTDTHLLNDPSGNVTSTPPTSGLTSSPPEATLPQQQQIQTMNMSIYAVTTNQIPLTQQRDSGATPEGGSSNSGQYDDHNNNNNNNNNTDQTSVSNGGVSPSTILASLRAKRAARQTLKAGSVSNSSDTSGIGTGTSSAVPSTVHSFIGNNTSLK